MTQTTVPEGFGEALRAFENGDLTRASALLEGCIRSTPDHAGSRFGLAMCRLRQGDVAQAQRLLRETVALDPSHVHARQQLDLLSRQDGAPPAREATPRTTPAADEGTLAGALDSPSDDPAGYSGALVSHGRRRLASHRSAAVSVLLLAAIPGLALAGEALVDQLASTVDVEIPSALGTGLRVAQVGCAVAAFLAMLLAALSCQLTTYRIFERRIDLRAGVLLRSYRQVWLYDVNDLQLSQTPLLTLAGTGRLRVVVDEAPNGAKPPTIVGLGSYRQMQHLLADVQHRVLKERRAMKKQFL